MHDGHDHGPTTPTVCTCPPGEPCTCAMSLIKEAHDTFPHYHDAESRTLPVGEEFSTTLQYLTYHNFGDFDVDGAEIVLLDRPIDSEFDPQQTGHGFIGHSGGSTKLRNVTIRGEHLAVVPGHVLFTGSHTVDIEGCTIDGVGRTTMAQLDNAHLGPNRELLHAPTNQIGRYALHLHHLTTAFRVVGTTITNGRKVALAIHNSDGGLVDSVIVDNFAGAGIVLEAGSENDNTIRNCRVTNIRGDGKGVQGHDGGIEPMLAGDDTPGNPRRTKGGLFSEGAAYWCRSIANDIVDNYGADSDFGCVVWGRNLGDDGGKQLGHRFSGNEYERVKTGFNVQGTAGPFVIDHQTVRDFGVAFDMSYNEHIVLQDVLLENGDTCWRNGFTEKLTANNVTVRNVKKGFEILADLEVNGGDYTGIPGSAFNIFYRHVPRQQRQIAIRGAKMNGLSYAFNDANKNVDYGIPQDVLVYGHNGEDFQVFMREQAGDYVPKNIADGNPRRMTPEPGLTNAQLWEKYAWQFGGKPIPAGATTKPGITGLCAPIGDLTAPKIIERTVTATANSITIRTKLDKPARIRTEYAIGDIQLGKWPLMVLPSELATEHVVTLSGLKPNTAYSYRQPAVDAAGNLGGDVRTSGINYQVTVVRTAK